MSAIPVSVIIVSRHRTAALLRCLTGLAQSDHPQFEVIVVADPATCAAVRGVAKLAAFDEANISAARNIGLGLAAGEVVAFIDDDAVPEPSWLSRLTAPFADSLVVSATGFVRGRNGITMQWQGVAVDGDAMDHDLVVDPKAVSLHQSTTQRAVKTHGTNCAFRRDALLAGGGFDPNLRFYLDEADVNLRMAGLTAVVPLAQVHHGFAASARRRADRVPTDLTEIGASLAVFLRRHSGDMQAALATQAALQKARLQRLVTEKRIAEADMARLMATLAKGMAEQRPPSELKPICPTPPMFSPLPQTGPRAGRVIAGRVWQRRALALQAQHAVARGEVVTVLRFSPTALYHRHMFHPDGYWLQTGGIWGRAERNESIFQAFGFSGRVAQQTERLSAFRPSGSAHRVADSRL